MEFSSKTRSCRFFQDEAEAAANFYVSLMPGSEIENIVRAGPNGPVVVVEFSLAGAPFMCLNGNPQFVSTHSFSISVLTEDQAEIDTLWNAFTEDGGEEGMCGWCKDRFGVHWQVVPKALPRLMSQDGATAGRVQAAMMKMKKIVIADLEAAAGG